MKIQVLEACDGFQIILTNSENQEIRYSFDQEETHQNLVDLFYKLGFTDVTYEEVY
jgi:hypothetical protein